MAHEDGLAMRDIVDGLLKSADGIELGRVADVEAEWTEDGVARLTTLIVGPEALLARISSRLRPLARWLFRGRWEHRIPVEEVAELGPTITLRHNASHYSTGHADEWVYRHILRFVPGSGVR